MNELPRTSQTMWKTSVGAIVGGCMAVVLTSVSRRDSILDLLLSLAAAITGIAIAAALAQRSLSVLTALLVLAVIVGSLIAIAGVVQRDAVFILCGAAFVGGAILLWRNREAFVNV